MALPSGYTKLEYIESTGTQYIDTMVLPAETRILIDAYILESNTGDDHHIASASWAETGKTELFNTMRLRADRTGFAVRYLNGNLRNVEHQGNVYGRHIFDRNFLSTPYTAQVDEAAGLTLTPSISGSISCRLPLFAFRRNNGSCSGFISMRLYSCKIWKTTTYEGALLIRDFIPCKNASGEVGLWDDVNSVFYGNAGTGTFIAGELPALTAHKTFINGTAYTVQGGKCMVDGTVYNILKGRTLIDGTGWDITFPAPLVMPVKGDLITMNLDGTDRQYRVLKVVDETTVEVLGMWNLSTSIAFGSSNAYSNSALDRYLNTTWYNTLSIAAKAAIVPKTITQDSWFFGTSGSPQYSGTYGTTSPGTFSYTISLYSQENLSVGNRYVYAMSVQDVLDYLSDTNVLVDTSGMLRNRNIWKMFWNKTSTGNGDIWLRSKDADSQTRTCIIDAGYGSISSWAISKTAAARPAFQIDLSKIDFTIGGQA